MELLQQLLPYAISLIALYFAFKKNNRDEQKSAIEGLQVQMDSMEKQLKEEQTKNHLITEILQGRDEHAQEFQRKGNAAFEIIGKVYGDVQEIKGVTLDIQSTINGSNLTTKIK